MHTTVRSPAAMAGSEATQLAEERAAVAAAARRLADAGLVERTAGNVSARAGELVAVTPTGAQLGQLEPDDVTVVDLDGRVVGGRLAPTSETALHLAVYASTDAGAVAHTHAPMATAVGCVVDELPLVHYEMLALGGPVRVAPYATFGTHELADSVATALEGRSAALMQNHGTVAIGPDPAAAVELTLLLEWSATLFWRARQIGEPRALGDDEVRDFFDTVARRGYGATREVGDE
jgi:L-fuculose-phosphate aldolase